MLEALVIVLLALWLLGVATSYTMGGLIHVLVVIALVVLIYRLVRGRPVR
ncbi:lmo0937 family membrane protein [Ramlibacter ginsenosidimutans]|uniref:Lmo0937 family membrane protein n=1 Tax=Ramlibacter ginsenosidimutans TaxID=502333 RepID=A0A934TT48_9BURK|nr:lmo0937 family membrane protein [Ramlibacter ginsenosidimutans]MBK6006898.1 lmo0937 family membrane protein [Ramlibacter ginsenosidimutans]